MSNSSQTPHCAACGVGTQANHTLLWIDSLSDAFTFAVPVHKLPFYATLYSLTDLLITGVGRVLLTIGQVVGAVKLSTDISTAVSNRSALLWKEALRRGLDIRHVLILNKGTDIFRIRHSGRTYLFTSLPHQTPAQALRMDDKVLFKQTLAAKGLPVPTSYSARDFTTAARAFDDMEVVCVKPRTGSNGRHTFPYVRTKEQLKEALASTKQISPFVSVETHIEGDLCRATCVDGVLIGFMQSEHPHIVGNGTSTVADLIAARNAAKQPGTSDIELSDELTGYIARRGYELSAVVPSGERIQLTYRGGRSVASTNREHSRAIHPSFIPLIEAAANATGLPVVGFDIIIPDPLQPADSQTWGFIEANSLPWIDLHATPYYGTPVDLSPAVWDLWAKQHNVVL